VRVAFDGVKGIQEMSGWIQSSVGHIHVTLDHFLFHRRTYCLMDLIDDAAFLSILEWETRGMMVACAIGNGFPILVGSVSHPPTSFGKMKRQCDDDLIHHDSGG
jgi:hypothetical protein